MEKLLLKQFSVLIPVLEGNETQVEESLRHSLGCNFPSFALAEIKVKE